jgi:hypothetical protein
MLRYRRHGLGNSSNETEIFEPDFADYNSTERKSSSNSSSREGVHHNETGFNQDSVKLLRCNVILMNHKINSDDIRRSANSTQPEIISYHNKNGHSHINKNDKNSKNKIDLDFILVGTNNSYEDMENTANGNFCAQYLLTKF